MGNAPSCHSAGHGSLRAQHVMESVSWHAPASRWVGFDVLIWGQMLVELRTSTTALLPRSAGKTGAASCLRRGITEKM